jgi:energy-coupling factor transporter transmembrane protein EcfT
MLIQAAHKIKTAQIARGADIESGFFNRVRFAFSATLPLFASAFRSAEHLALAMESRCYDPDAERTRFGDLKMHARDWLVLFALLGTFTLVTAASG